MSFPPFGPVVRAFFTSSKDHWKELVGGSFVALLIGAAMAVGLDVPHVVAGITAFSLAAIFACFMAFRDQFRKVQELTRPALRGHIVSVGIGNTSYGAGITVLLQLTNIGPPTIADRFVAVIRSRIYPTVYLPPDSKFSDDASNVVRIDPADMLYEKLMNPIPEGGRVSGFLFFITKDISASDLANSTRPEIAINFRDASLKEYSATTSGPGREQPLYEPGVRDPFISLASQRASANDEQKRQALLVKIRDLILSKKDKRSDARVDLLGALVEFSDEFTDEAQVVWTCEQMEQRGFEHPFKVLSSSAPGVFDGRYLSFLQDARTCAIEVKRLASAVSCAFKYWRYAEDYKKAHGTYIGFSGSDEYVQLPSLPAVPDEVILRLQDEVNLRLTALDELKAIRDQGDRFLETFYTKGGSGQKPTAEQVEAYVERMIIFVKGKNLDVTAQEFTLFATAWPNQDRYNITSKLAMAGCFEGNDSETFELLWDRVERLKQLIYTLENK